MASGLSHQSPTTTTATAAHSGACAVVQCLRIPERIQFHLLFHHDNQAIDGFTEVDIA